jgi:hypothetical protein
VQRDVHSIEDFLHGLVCRHEQYMENKPLGDNDEEFLLKAKVIANSYE